MDKRNEASNESCLKDHRVICEDKKKVKEKEKKRNANRSS